jgi:hypothetical protein
MNKRDPLKHNITSICQLCSFSTLYNVDNDVENVSTSLSTPSQLSTHCLPTCLDNYYRRVDAHHWLTDV